MLSRGEEGWARSVAELPASIITLALAQKPKIVISFIFQIIRRYDIVVVQEIRDVKQTAFPFLLAEVNK
jgi:hypothetical protein